VKERAAAPDWRLAGNKEDHVVGHETENKIDVTGGGGPVPMRNEIANGLFVSAHGD
jgi:hypothetical protein